MGWGSTAGTGVVTGDGGKDTVVTGTRTQDVSGHEVRRGQEGGTSPMAAG